MPSTRFVILHHRTADGEHWDLMIEQPDALATWRLEDYPGDRQGEAIAARRLGDHRKRYLEYEGPLSGGRGEVARVEAGVCELDRFDQDAWTVRLQGSRCVGEYDLRRIDGDRWQLQPAAQRVHQTVRRVK